MVSQNIKAVTDSSFENDVIKNTKPVLVDFWATWCAPCRALAPIIEEVANQYVGKVEVYKMDVDHNPQTPGRYGIRGIPTVILFKGGQAVNQVVGAVPRDQIEGIIKKAL